MPAYRSFDAAVFEALFATAPDAMVAVDRNGVIVLANPQAERLFGYPPGALAGRAVEALLPAAVRQAHVGHRTHYMANPRVRPMGAGYELTGVRADGQTFPVEIGLSPVTAAEEKLFVASIRDISETQRARQALMRARYDANLAQVSRRLLEATHDEQAVCDILALVAATLDIEAASTLLVDPRHAGLRAQAAVGLTEPQLAGLPENRPLKALAAEQIVDDDGLPSATGLIGKLAQASPALAAGFADAALVPLPDRLAPMGFLLGLSREPGRFDRDRLQFLQSVAHMLAAANQRSRSEEQLAHAQRLDALGQLTGGIAHDFNNLLTVVSGNLQLLESGACSGPEVNETIESALRAVERGAALTRKLLTFSRRQHLLPRAVDPAVLLGDLSEMLGRTLGDRIAVSADCPSDIPAVYADPGELEAALLNLALNARDAMPRGGRLTLVVRAFLAEAQAEPRLAPGRYVVFSVADTGAGMTPEVQARAFEPFFTTKEAGKGSGLGLSMVYGFVKQSGGQMHMDSQQGQGTRVELYLPAAPAGSAQDLPLPASRPGHETILVVEDEAEVRRVAVAFLRTLGYVALEAEDAAAALELLAAREDIDLMFSDIMLGEGLTGYELAAKARATRPTLRLLFASGYEYAPGETDTRILGAVELLRKPYRREQLGAALRRALDRSA